MSTSKGRFTRIAFPAMEPPPKSRDFVSWSCSGDAADSVDTKDMSFSITLLFFRTSYSRVMPVTVSLEKAASIFPERRAGML